MPIFGKIYSPKLCLMTEYYQLNGCATVYTLHKLLSISERTAYRHNNILAEIGFINQVSEVPKTGRMKRPSIVWGIEDCLPRQSRSAIDLHLRLMMPKRIVSESIAYCLLDSPTIIDYYEIKYDDVLSFIKESQTEVHPKSVPRIADQVCQILHGKGVKIIFSR